MTNRFVYLPRDDLCTTPGLGGVEVYRLKNAAFPELVGAIYDIDLVAMKQSDVYRKYARRVLKEFANIRPSTKVDLRCLGD